jgi:LuxR family transcriptional regulator, quorum-sensing system regulator SolR
MNQSMITLGFAVKDARSQEEVFSCVARAGQQLGFDKAMYASKQYISLTQPKLHIQSNYPQAWIAHYTLNSYAQRDPVVIQTMKAQSVVIWSEQLYESQMQMWLEAQAHGLRVGWGFAVQQQPDAVGLVALAREFDEISSSELQQKEPQLRWLTYCAEQRMTQLRQAKRLAQQSKADSFAWAKPTEKTSGNPLSERECDILRWTADGKTAEDIGLIINVATRTVNFHLNHVMTVLSVPNKTAAVARALIRGWLF